MKVLIKAHEWYPVYTIRTAAVDINDDGIPPEYFAEHAIEISDDLYLRYGDILAEFSDMQFELSKLAK